jgi:hypothetical protein
MQDAFLHWQTGRQELYEYSQCICICIAYRRGGAMYISSALSTYDWEDMSLFVTNSFGRAF